MRSTNPKVNVVRNLAVECEVAIIMGIVIGLSL